jgi:hypothetical protein
MQLVIKPQAQPFSQQQSYILLKYKSLIRTAFLKPNRLKTRANIRLSISTQKHRNLARYNPYSISQ